MAVQTKRALMDQDDMQRAVKRIAHQIIENTNDTGALVLVGIKRRGVSIARELADDIKNIAGVEIPLGVLDITFYRDDLSKESERPVLNDTQIDFDVTGRQVILVDDVLYTGRTARAAMDAIMDLGRPAFIKLVALVDRGHRELPIRADFIGKNIPTAQDESVFVHVPEYDGCKKVCIEKTNHD